MNHPNTTQRWYLEYIFQLGSQSLEWDCLQKMQQQLAQLHA